MVEGARLESVCRGNSTVGSNPTLSASSNFANFLSKLINPLAKTATEFHFAFHSARNRRRFDGPSVGLRRKFLSRLRLRP